LASATVLRPVVAPALVFLPSKRKPEEVVVDFIEEFPPAPKKKHNYS
jgi:hypothetical protein